MIFRHKGNKRNTAPAIVIWITLTMALGMIGTGIAVWQEGIGISGVVSTGNIAPVFTSAQATSGGRALITDNQKTIAIAIEEACPGDAFKFGYTVTNYGSVPVRLEIIEENMGPEIRILNLLPRNFIAGNGDSTAGELLIKVCDDAEGLQENTAYNFNLRLFFQQWNNVF